MEAMTSHIREFIKGPHHVMHLSMRSAHNTMGIGGPCNDNRNLWYHRWEGPNDSSVGEGPGREECLPLPEIMSHKDKAIIIG